MLYENGADNMACQTKLKIINNQVYILAWTTSGELGLPAKQIVPLKKGYGDRNPVTPPEGVDNLGRLGSASKAHRPARDSERN